MSYRRHRVNSETPTEVYIVTDGTSHRLYSTLGAARGVRTRELKYNPLRRSWKIYKLVVSDNLEEVDG